MILYWPGEDHDRPSGGVRTHYDHVRHLNALGLDAAILTTTPNFRPTWFENADVPIVDVTERGLSTRDVLVVNEILGPETAQMGHAKLRKVIFAQNVHYTWRNWPIPPESPPPQHDSSVLATLVLTETERTFFRWAYPAHPVYTIRHGIDDTLYVPRPKKRQIAYMPRKHEDEAQQVFGWLSAVGALKGWDVVVIHGMHERDVARVLGESLLFFAFGYPEGGTLPPFEAMLAGCAVVGYGGCASDKDLAACGGWLVQSADTCAFVRTAQDVLSQAPSVLAYQGQISRERVRQRFSREQEREALRTTWTTILEQRWPSAPAAASRCTAAASSAGTVGTAAASVPG